MMTVKFNSNKLGNISTTKSEITASNELNINPTYTIMATGSVSAAAATWWHSTLLKE